MGADTNHITMRGMGFVIVVRAYRESDLPAMAEIWNEIVEDGVAFPQEELLDLEGAREFFGSQTYCGVALMIPDTLENGESAPEESELLGLYILHPNNIGRCGHIANASYAVRRNTRGVHIGETLVADSPHAGEEIWFWRDAVQCSCRVERARQTSL